MLEKFEQHLKTNFPNLLSEKFLLGCSGGLDSVVLTHLCHRSGLDFEMAHCNFQLRGAESNRDEKFVSQLAKNLNIGFHITHFDTIGYIHKNKVNIQIAARDLRYAWFAELMKENGIPTLVTAHQADDNLETYLINLSRGTGIDGLIGIPPKTDSISRPLLAFSREQIQKYAKTERLKWVEDSSNTNVKYLRNKIRHEIVPVLKELHPTFLKNFERSQSHLRGVNTILSNHIELLKSKVFEKSKDGFRIAVEELTVLHPQNAYLYELFKGFGFTSWKDISKLLVGMTGKEVRSKTHRLVKDRNHLLLEAIQIEASEIYTIREGQNEVTFPVHLIIKNVDSLQETNKNILYADKDSLKYPLTVRKWEKGDYFYPFGMQGTKKLSKYFKDEKVDVLSKEKQWLLCSGEDIIWVIGRRADQRFSVSERTKNILKFTLLT